MNNIFTKKIKKQPRIGNIVLSNPILLAPMAGVTDLPFRILCKEYGASLVYSEMISAKGILYNNENTKVMLNISDTERPTAIQLFGREPELLAEIAKKIECFSPDIIDINMGCPAPKIVKNGEGSALLKDPLLIGKIIYSVSRAVNIPVTVKIRSGFDSSSINAAEVAKIAEQSGASAIAVHARTREQYYSGKADWEVIAKVKHTVKIPVIGNGDVFSPNDALDMFLFTKCDAVMVGRAAEGNPFLFRSILHFFETGEILPDVPLNEKIYVALRHCDMLVELKGEHIAMLEMRRHLSHYLKGVKGGAELKLKIHTTDKLSKIKEFLYSLIN